MTGEPRLIPPSDEVMRSTYTTAIIEMVATKGFDTQALECRLRAKSLADLVLIWIGLPLNIDAALAGMFPTMYYAALPDPHRPVIHFPLMPSDQLDIDMGIHYLTKVPLPT